MLMKRIYKPSAGENSGIPELDYVELYDTGSTPAQNFSDRLVMKGILEGWLALKGNRLTLSVRPEPLQYTVTRVPGRYCLFCEADGDPSRGKLSGHGEDPTGADARKHIADRHHEALLGTGSPDPQWPHGYAVLNQYECVLDAGQHEKFKFSAAGQPGLRGIPPAHVRAIRSVEKGGASG